MTEPLAQYKIEHGSLNGHSLTHGLLFVHHDKLKYAAENDQTFTFLITKILIHAVRKTEKDEETELYSQFREDGLLDEAASSAYLCKGDSENGDDNSGAEDEEMKFAEVAFTFHSYETAHSAFNLIEERVRACDEVELQNNESSSSSGSEQMDDNEDVALALNSMASKVELLADLLRPSLNNNALLPALASHFVFHPCLTVEHFENRSDREYVALYVHHFFPDASKCLWGDDYKIHIHFIPTTFDTYVECEGITVNPQPPLKQPFVKTKSDPHEQHPNNNSTDSSASIELQVIQTLETQQGLFPGGFIKSKAKFLSLLSLKMQEQSNMVSFSGRAISHANVNFRDELGEDKVWIVECSLLNNEASTSDSTSGTELPFRFVHKRIEWYMHFFIDAMSSIEVDPRWRAFVPVRYLQKLSPLELLRLDDNAKNSKTLGDSLTEQSNRINKEWPQLDQATETTFLSSLAGTSQKMSPEGLQLMDLVLEEPQKPFEILGLVTVHQFFALPKHRARISQFFVFPHRQKVGLGRIVLASITERLCADENIRQITVEDPAPAFQRLRDVVSIDRAIRKRLLTVECLYPPEELSKSSALSWTDCPANPKVWPQYDEVFKNLLFESPQQRRRLKLLLTLCRMLPSELIGSDQTQLGSMQMETKRKKKRPAPGSLPKDEVGASQLHQDADNKLLDWNKKSKKMAPLRIQEKRRLRLESLDWYTQLRSLSEIQSELEIEWTLLFKSLCGAIHTLRRQFPLPNE